MKQGMYYVNKINDLKKQYRENKDNIRERKFKCRYYKDDIDYIKLDGSVYHKDGTVDFLVKKSGNTYKQLKTLLCSIFSETIFEFFEFNYDLDFEGICSIDALKITPKRINKSPLNRMVNKLKNEDFCIYSSEKITKTDNGFEVENLTEPFKIKSNDDNNNLDPFVYLKYFLFSYDGKRMIYEYQISKKDNNKNNGFDNLECLSFTDINKLPKKNKKNY